MFKVVLNDGQTPMPEDDIYYIIAKEGVYLKKKLGIMESIAPVKNISILQSVASSAKMHIQPIPGKWIAKVINFFKAVYTEYRSEAIVLLFYNEETGQHKIVPPHQKVAGASCDYDKGMTIDGYTMIGTIHSHANMSAFHSGVDDSDEEHFDGLHITLGNLGDKNPSISTSIVSNGFRQMIDPCEYVTNLSLVEETNQDSDKSVRTVYSWVNGKMVKKEEEVTKYGYYSYQTKKFDRRYEVTVPERDRIFNKNWMKMVEKGVYTYKSYHGGYAGWYGYSSHFGGNHWGSHYDPNAWSKSGRQTTPSIKTGTRVSPLATTCKKPLEFPPHTQEGDFVPCATCVHRDIKLTSEEDGDDYESYFYCKQCGEIVCDEDVEILQCTTCLTDEHLVLLDKDDLLTNHYVPGDEYDHMFAKDSAGVIEESEYTTCKTCGNKFRAFKDDIICPFCHTPAFSSEEESVEQMRSDSGEFLGSEADEIHSAALDAAASKVESPDKIPEPGTKIIPLPDKKDSTLFEMFKSVFGRGGRA